MKTPGRMIGVCGLLLVSLVATLRSEDTTELTGTVIVLQADDFERHRSETWHYLREETSGRLLRLRFAEEAIPPSLATGNKIRLRGQICGEELVAPSQLERLAADVLEAVAVPGDHQTLVIGVNFQNGVLECPTNTIAGMMFTGAESVDALYREISHGAVGFSGDVVGPFTIDFDTSDGDCQYYAWADAADAAALAAGVPVGQYQHKVYVLPYLNRCSWTGLATVGGNPGRVWVGQCNLADVYAHELGHNLGLRHAAADYNNDGRKDCEYCDNSDIMGYVGPGLRQLNAPHKEQLGWLPAGKIVTPTGAAIVQLAPLEFAPQDTGYAQALKILRPDGLSTYYFSYRRPVGFDANLLASYFDTLSVHYYGGDTNRSYLVTTLTDRGKFADPATGLTVTLLAHNGDYATAQVAYECYAVAPTIQFDSATLTAEAGMTTSTTVTVSNHDSPQCPAVVFHLTAKTRRSCTATLAPPSLTLAPGQSGTAQLSITLPAKSQPNTVTVSVADYINPAHSVSVDETIAPSLVDTTPPTTPTNVVVLRRQHSLRVRWERASDNIRVTGYVVWRNGIEIGRAHSHRFTDRTVETDATYQYSVTAFDAAGNSSPPSEQAVVTLSD